MIPGEYLHDGSDLEINAGRLVVELSVTNHGDRPIQVGSHFHFFEVNKALVFDRDKAFGMRLDLLAGTAVRFEPGDIRQVRLIPLAGRRIVFGGNGLVSGPLDDLGVRRQSLERIKARGFGDEKTVTSPQ